MAVFFGPSVVLRRAWRRRAMLFALILIWAMGITWGLCTMARYEFTPGHSAAPGAQWPCASRLPRIVGRSTLVLLAHPQCSCTRASLEELAKLLARSNGTPLTVFVLFVQPAGLEDFQVMSDIWTSAAEIPGVQVLKDPGGVEAARFGAATSGQVLLFDPAGQLTFSGGITAYRSHVGDNDGRSAIEAVVSGHTPARRSTPVFGCPLLNERP